MKNMLKRVTMIICSLTIALNLVGASVSESDAASNYVTFTYKVDVSLLGHVDNMGDYTIYLQSSNGSKIKLGTAKKSGLNYKLSGSSKVNIQKGTNQKVRIMVCGKNAMGKSVTRCTNYKDFKSTGIFAKSFKVRGNGYNPTLS